MQAFRVPFGASLGTLREDKNVQIHLVVINFNVFVFFLNFAHFGGPLEGFLGPSWGTFWAEISSSGRLQRSKIPLGLFFRSRDLPNYIFPASEPSRGLPKRSSGAPEGLLASPGPF